MCLASAAFAQKAVRAPAEERSHASTDPLGEAQQRVEFARRTSEQAGDRVKQAERVLKEFDAEFQSARKQLDQSALRRDAARRDLADAKSKAAVASKGYEKESAAFDRLRTTGKNGR